MAIDVREICVGETVAAYDALHALRAGLPFARTEFASFLDSTLRPEGYRLVGAFPAYASAAAAVAGFRPLTTLAFGRVLYVDDLSTVPAARRQGLARRLLGWLAEEASRTGCDQLQLDSGLGPTRADAHRLYFRTGMQICAFHFAQRVTATPR